MKMKMCRLEHRSDSWRLWPRDRDQTYRVVVGVLDVRVVEAGQERRGHGADAREERAAREVVGGLREVDAVSVEVQLARVLDRVGHGERDAVGRVDDQLADDLCSHI